MLSRKVAFIFFVNILRAGLNGIALFFIAQYMGPTPLGIVAFGLSFIGLFIFLPDLGFNAAHVKRISEGNDLPLCNGTFFTAKLALVSLMVVVVIGAVSLTKVQFESQEQLKVLYILIVYIIFLKLSEIAQITFEARRESAKQQIPLLLGDIVRTTSIIFVSIACLGVIALSASYVLGALVLLISSFIMFHGYPVSKPSMDYFRSYFRFALPISFYSIIVYINANVDKVMIGYFYHVNDVAFYFCGQQINFIIISLSAAAGMLIFPTISSLHSKNDLAGIQQLTYNSERYLSMIITPIVILCIIFAEPIITIFLGDRFLPAAQIFRILLIVTWISAINTPHEKQLPGLNRPGLGVKVASISIGMNIILNLILIPEQLFGVRLFGLGAIGAAMATVISCLPRFVLIRYYTYRLTHTGFKRCILFHPFAASMSGVILYYINTTISITRWYHLFGFGMAFASIYLLMLCLFGAFTKKDCIFFYNALHPTNMKEYVTSEIKDTKR